MGVRFSTTLADEYRAVAAAAAETDGSSPRCQNTWPSEAKTLNREQPARHPLLLLRQEHERNDTTPTILMSLIGLRQRFEEVRYRGYFDRYELTD